MSRILVIAILILMQTGVSLGDWRDSNSTLSKLNGISSGYWQDSPLNELVEVNPVIVIGKIIRIKIAEKPKDHSGTELYGYDTAFILIEEVLKDELDELELKKGMEIPLKMPSVINTMKVSVAIRHKEGSEGIWILEYREGAFWATHPKDHQKVGLRDQIIGMIKGSKGQKGSSGLRGKS